MREVGIATVAVAVLAATGLWLRQRARSQDAARAEVRMQLAMREDAAEVYRDQFAAVRAKAARLRADADGQTVEPGRTWARERAKRFEALLAKVDREAEARSFAQVRRTVAQLTAKGKVDEARVALASASAPEFPTPAEFERLRREVYEEPLTEFSRQNPALYREFREHEAEIAQRDEQALRAEIAGLGSSNVTPQLMLKVDLLAAVAAPDDPVVTEWSALASALDYFEEPDGETLARWRRAQQAQRRNDWGTATAEMQAILKAKVRTRQPFRATLGRTLLRQRPDQPDEAYPYLAEAAAAGDKAARAWVAKEDYSKGRAAQAERWLEAAVADGEFDGVPMLLDLYDKHGAAKDPSHKIGVLERVTDRPEAPAEAFLFLGRLYERVDPPGARPSRAFAQYQRAAAKGSGAGEAEVARCALRGKGTAQNSDLARDAACRAYGRGERAVSVPVLKELMEDMPERAAGAVQAMFDQESVSGGGGYMESRTVEGPGVIELKALLARYLDRIGQFGQAAKFYQASRDPAAAKRHAELTASHPCETCGGKGKVLESAPCPTCGGKGKQICSVCGGIGFSYVPGTPPCSACGGSGTMVQDRKTVSCSTCGGSGKGKGSVVKQDCPTCDHGQVRCVACEDGSIKVPKECPECHGKGAWKLSDR
ncbi:hypothetical protein DB354_20510 [Opitutus sp. ER46]|nr:hypothetical protein DB354_20510 [Opitutus sp. ER46]